MQGLVIKLRELCKEVLAKLEFETTTAQINVIEDGKLSVKEQPARKVLNPEVAEELLPTQSGFFFGGTAYDEWYVQDLELTIKQLDRVLDATKPKADPDSDVMDFGPNA